jgi:hypothetical protein
MRTVVTALNVLSSMACLAMAGLGVLVLMLTQLDPLHTDHLGIAFGSGLLTTFLIVPVVCVVTSRRLLKRGNRSSIFLAFLPFVFVALGFWVYHIFPWPPVPAN